MNAAHPLRALRAACLAALAVASVAPSPVRAGAAGDTDDLLSLSLEELANVPVTAASRSDVALWSTPAETHVIRREDILRSGVTTLADALRLAPGVEVARVTSQAWSVTMRGFNGDLSNKLLVLIDGRSVYSPLFGGVYWDLQDYLLDDVERIELVGGPGGALWGANAVSGVINVVTRSAGASPGVSVEVGGGEQERRFASARAARAMSETVDARGYLKYADRDAFGANADDRWRMVQGGGRIDWRTRPNESFTLQGDVYRSEKEGIYRSAFVVGAPAPPAEPDQSDSLGANVLGRWERRNDAGGETLLQFYVDLTRRELPNTYDESRLTADLDFQRRLAPRGRHDVLWGLGTRVTRDRLDNTTFATFEPSRRTDSTFSGFVQDRIALAADRVFVTLGSKFERNDYTGWEVQPSARLWWGIDTRQAAWVAVSRAVRTPARIEHDLRLTTPFTLPTVPLPLYVRVDGDRDVTSEKLVAYEAGYRVRFGESVSLDLSVYHHDYEDLVTQEARQPIFVTNVPNPYIVLPNVLDNLMHGSVDGATLAATVQPHRRWRLQADWTWTEFDLRTEPGSNSRAPAQVAGRSPRNQYALHSYVDFPHGLSFYTGVRRVGALATPKVPAYTAVDVSLRWDATPALQVSLTARNATDAEHFEFGTGASNANERSVYGAVRWRY